MYRALILSSLKHQIGFGRTTVFILLKERFLQPGKFLKRCSSQASMQKIKPLITGERGYI